MCIHDTKGQIRHIQTVLDTDPEAENVKFKKIK
jgi:hypothetical protein